MHRHEPSPEIFSPAAFGACVVVVPDAGPDDEGGWHAATRALSGGAARRPVDATASTADAPPRALVLCPDADTAAAARAALEPAGAAIDAVVLPPHVVAYTAEHQRAFLHLAAHLLWRSPVIVRERDHAAGYAALLEHVVPRLCAHRDPEHVPRCLRVKRIDRS